MKLHIPLTVAAVLLTTAPALADLETHYNNQKAAEARENDCRHWFAAQWRSKGSHGSLGFGRIREFPDGRLLETKIEINRNGQLECRNSRFVGYGKSKLGYSKKIFGDGSGSESTKKIQGNQLIEFYSLCSDWKCKRRRISKLVMATKLSPSQKSDEDAYVLAALAKATECKKSSDYCGFTFTDLESKISIPEFGIRTLLQMRPGE